MNLNFPAHKAGLILSHNEHLSTYQTVEEAIENTEGIEWKNEQQKAQSITTNELWTLHWYPNTPVGFNLIAAPTLEDLLIFANEFA